MNKMQADRDFDVCLSCGAILFEGTSVNPFILCDPCLHMFNSRRQNPGHCSWQQQQQQQQQQHVSVCRNCGFRDAPGQIDDNEGPVRCSSPKLDFTRGKRSRF